LSPFYFNIFDFGFNTSLFGSLYVVLPEKSIFFHVDELFGIGSFQQVNEATSVELGMGT
jgi:hypothetical protein